MIFKIYYLDRLDRIKQFEIFSDRNLFRNHTLWVTSLTTSLTVEDPEEGRLWLFPPEGNSMNVNGNFHSHRGYL